MGKRIRQRRAAFGGRCGVSGTSAEPDALGPEPNTGICLIPEMKRIKIKPPQQHCRRQDSLKQPLKRVVFQRRENGWREAAGGQFDPIQESCHDIQGLCVCARC